MNSQTEGLTSLLRSVSTSTSRRFNVMLWQSTQEWQFIRASVHQRKFLESSIEIIHGGLHTNALSAEKRQKEKRNVCRTDKKKKKKRKEREGRMTGVPFLPFLRCEYVIVVVLMMVMVATAVWQE